jgi:O-antigen ligase
MKKTAQYLLFILILIFPYRSALWINSFWNGQKMVGFLLFAVFVIAWVRQEVRVSSRMIWTWAALICARVAVSLCSSIVTPRPLNLDVFVSWVQFIFVLIVTTSLLDDSRAVRRCMLVCVVSGTLASLVFLNQYRAAADLFYNFQGGDRYALVRDLATARDPSQKLFGIFSSREVDLEQGLGSTGNPVHLSMILVALIPLAFMFVKELKRARSWLKMAAVVTALLAILAALIMTFSRTAYIVALLEIVVLLARERRNAWKWTFGIVIVAGLVYMTLNSIGATASLETRAGQLISLLNGNISDDPSAAMRSGVHRAMFTFIQEHPVVGIGFGNFRLAALSYSGLAYAQQGEDLYLQLMAESGLPYWILFWTLVACLVAPALRKTALDPACGSALKLAMAGILVTSLTLYTEFEYFPYVFAGMLLSATQVAGSALARSRIESSLGISTA